MPKQRRFRLRGELRLKNARLVRCREELGLNQRQFAEKVGIHFQLYNGYETLRGYPSKRNRQILAAFVGCSEEELFPPELKRFAKKGPRVLVGESSIAPIRLIGLSRREVLALPAPAAIEEMIEEEELRAVLERSLETLKARDRKILELHYGFGGAEPMTFEEIGKLMGITGNRVNQIHKRALQRLRELSRSGHELGKGLLEVAINW